MKTIFIYQIFTYLPNNLLIDPNIFLIIDDLLLISITNQCLSAELKILIIAISLKINKLITSYKC